MRFVGKDPRFAVRDPNGFLQQITADGVRRVLARLQPDARKPSRFVQVHPRSRARR